MADTEMNKLPLDLLEHVSGGRLSQMDRDAMDMFIRVEKNNHGSRDSLIRFMQRYLDERGYIEVDGLVNGDGTLTLEGAPFLVYQS